MNTIQDQLREHGELIDDAYNSPGHASPWAVELYEAADRIDALEAMLRRVDRCLGDGCRACRVDIRNLVGKASS